jgi:hypothetical protein
MKRPWQNFHFGKKGYENFAPTCRDKFHLAKRQ